MRKISLTMLTMLLTIVLVSQINAAPDPGIPSALAVIQDKSTGMGMIRLLNLVNYKWTKTSPLQFAFQAPLAKLTYSPVQQNVYLVSYPISPSAPAAPPVATLYQLDLKTLNVTQMWTSSTDFFDIQYVDRVLGGGLYGITVTSQFGRSFAEFNLANSKGTVSAIPYFPLPSNYYVNSSSYSGRSRTYYALLNTFPGIVNTSVNQMLMTVDLSGLKPVPTFVTLTPFAQSLIYFSSITFSEPHQTLYAVGRSYLNQTTVMAIINADGSLQVPWTSNLAPGPLISDSVLQNVYEFSNNYGPAGFSVVDFDLYTSPGSSGFILTNYPGPYQVITANFVEGV